MNKADISAIPDMQALRAAIDALDLRLAGLLAERTLLIDRAAQIKAGAGLPARIDERVEEVAGKARRNAEAAGYDPDLAEARTGSRSRFDPRGVPPLPRGATPPATARREEG